MRLHQDGPVLALAPHTDDAELGAGGTLARLVEEGAEVHVSAFSTARASLPPGSDPDQLRNEFLRAMDLLDIPVDQVHVFDYPVRKLSYSRQEVLEHLVILRKEVAPALILTPASTDLHQDHEVLFKEAMRAFKDRTVLGYELPWNHVDFSAQAFVSLAERHVDKKLTMLREYQSQLEKGRPYFSDDFIRGLARVRGVQVGSPYAEAFEVLRVNV